MTKQLPRTEKEITDIFVRNSNTVFRICFMYMKNTPDAEDAVQDTFLRLIKSGPFFESTEHEKAWLIRTAMNVCKNKLRHWWLKRENIEDLYELLQSEDVIIDDLFREILSLPSKYKTVIFLHYYEGYTSAEIAGILKKPASTIRYWLSEARTLLKERIGEDYEE